LNLDREKGRRGTHKGITFLSEKGRTLSEEGNECWDKRNFPNREFSSPKGVGGKREEARIMIEVIGVHHQQRHEGDER